MKKIKFLAATVVALSAVTPSNAGGMLTNTNQSVAFLRNPAREAAIGIDGVYSNPAGVAFLKDGWHFNVNWQCAVQTREVETTSPLLDHTLSGNNKTVRYRGHATAPCIPSLSASYNKGKLSYQFHFAVSGGGGKCQYENGLGDFEAAVGGIAFKLKNNSTLAGYKVNALGYGVDCYMEGRQYYYGITLGAAYKILPNLSVYGGLRALIADANYQAQIQNITVATNKYGLQTFGDYMNTAELQGVVSSLKNTYDTYSGYTHEQLVAGVGEANAQAIEKAFESYQEMNMLKEYGDNNGVDLNSDQSGFGIAPIIGIDWKLNKHFNFAAKYEFRTKMSLKNHSNLTKSSLDATAQYVDGTSVRDDSPALLALGAQVSPIDIVRVNLGYHHFYDLDAQKFNDRQKLLKNGTNEYLGGVEVDCTDRLIVSCGAQITRYGNTDEYMSDQSFVTNSWSFGFGASYQANPNVKIEAAYFKTFYDNYTGTTTNASGIVTTDNFTRTNDVIGVGLVIDL